MYFHLRSDDVVIWSNHPDVNDALNDINTYIRNFNDFKKVDPTHPAVTLATIYSIFAARKTPSFIFNKLTQNQLFCLGKNFHK